MTNETNVYHMDNIWFLGKLDLKDYGSENNRGYRYVLVVIGNFTNFGRTAPLNKKSARTMKDSFENILLSLKGKPKLSETDPGKDFYDIFFRSSWKQQQ